MDGKCVCLTGYVYSYYVCRIGELCQMYLKFLKSSILHWEYCDYSVGKKRYGNVIGLKVYHPTGRAKCVLFY